MSHARPKLLPVDKATAAGAATYSKFTLRFYDFVVMGLESRVMYHLPASAILDHYNAHVTDNHLEIGVGSGYFLDKCTFPSPQPSITLLDLNRDCLETTARRIRRYWPRQTQQNILAPIQLNGARFDSVGLNYVLHCLPGTMLEKAVVFENIRRVLSEDGVVFGTTVLGRNVKHGRVEKAVLGLYNRLGILTNRDDDAESLETILRRYFQQVSVQVKSRCIAFFEARGFA